MYLRWHSQRPSESVWSALQTNFSIVSLTLAKAFLCIFCDATSKSISQQDSPLKWYNDHDTQTNKHIRRRTISCLLHDKYKFRIPPRGPLINKITKIYSNAYCELIDLSDIYFKTKSYPRPIQSIHRDVYLTCTC